MEQSPSWEANRFSASQEIPRISLNPKVHYGIHKCPPAVSILGQLDPVYIPTSHVLKIHLNIILPSTPGSSKWSLSVRFPAKTLYTPLLSPHTLYMPSPSHSRFCHPNNIWRGIQIINLLIMSLPRAIYVLIKEKIFFPHLIPSYLWCDRLVISVVSLRNLLKRRLRSWTYACKLSEYQL